VTAVTLTIGSASVWEAVMHNPAARLVPVQLGGDLLDPAAFITIWLVSLLDRSARGNEDRAASRRSRCVPRPASAPRAHRATDRAQRELSRGRWRIVAALLPFRTMPTSATEPQREMLTLVTARIRDAYLRKPYYVDGGADLVSVCRELSAHA